MHQGEDKYSIQPEKSIIRAATNKISFGKIWSKINWWHEKMFNVSAQENVKAAIEISMVGVSFYLSQFPCCYYFCADLWHNYPVEHNNLQAHLQHHLFSLEPIIKYNWSITSKSPSQPSRIAACWKALLLFLNCFSF